ncbi:hypothetical protein MSHOH_0514 [Methanosarcina horonobensis HB-1 = JCM 15518]|uniref:Uncharacterized protein n=2 Tax=Methanosarcina horonobensis TaxID=418008 RepID=A0A0E3SB67_9EURY|nr:hypothetical protein MSHOH_0514 [Methanosarcina horonobensis HB-1 = JCM 15518]
MFIKIFRVSVLAVFVLVSIAGAAPFAYVTTIGIDTGTVFVIDTATNTVTATVNTGKYTMNGPVGVVIGPFTGSNRNEKSTGATANEPDQSTIATSNATEKIGVEEINLSSSEEKNTVEFNNSNNNNYNDTNNSESNNGSSSGQNESNKNNSTPGFGLLVSLACMYGERKLWKK